MIKYKIKFLHILRSHEVAYILLDMNNVKNILQPLSLQIYLVPTPSQILKHL